MKCSSLILAAALVLPAAAATQPNILWLLAEDVGPEAFGFSGAPEAHTPVIDHMAADGVNYTRAYTTAPICSSARSAFMTGMYANSISAQDHRTANKDKKPLPPGVETLPARLRQAGYFTANLVTFPAAVAQTGAGKVDWNFKVTEPPFEGKDWAELKVHQPFYAQVNFSETHRKFHAPPEADPAKVALPPYYPDQPVARQDWAAYLDSARELDRKVDRILKQLAADGLADNTIVVFMGDNGQAQVRGKQFLYEEGLHVPLIIRWPKNIPTPAGFTPGKADPRLLEATDLTATTLAWAGVKKPPGMQGRVFMGADAEPPRKFVFGARDRADETVMHLRTVSDGQFRYIRNLTPGVPFFAPNKYKESQYPVWNLMQELHRQGKLDAVQEALCQPRMPAEELYDLTADPQEIHNLADSSDPRAKAALANLRGELDRWMKDTRDPRKTPEQAPRKPRN